MPAAKTTRVGLYALRRFWICRVIRKCARNPSGNAISAANGRSVIATSNSASPNSHTKLSPPNACDHCGLRFPDGTRGFSAAQKRGTARQ